MSALNSGTVSKTENPLAKNNDDSEEESDEDAPLSPKQRMAKFENQWCILHVPGTAYVPLTVAHC